MICIASNSAEHLATRSSEKRSEFFSIVADILTKFSVFSRKATETVKLFWGQLQQSYKSQ